MPNYSQYSFQFKTLKKSLVYIDSNGSLNQKLHLRVVEKSTFCQRLFVCLFTSSSSTLRGLVKDLNGNENKDININVNIDYSLVIF